MVDVLHVRAMETPETKQISSSSKRPAGGGWTTFLKYKSQIGSFLHGSGLKNWQKILDTTS